MLSNPNKLKSQKSCFPTGILATNDSPKVLLWTKPHRALTKSNISQILPSDHQSSNSWCRTNHGTTVAMNRNSKHTSSHTKPLLSNHHSCNQQQLKTCMSKLLLKNYQSCSQNDLELYISKLLGLKVLHRVPQVCADVLSSKLFILQILTRLGLVLAASGGPALHHRKS